MRPYAKLYAEEVTTPRTRDGSAAARERTRQSMLYTNNFLVREAATYVPRGTDVSLNRALIQP